MLQNWNEKPVGSFGSFLPCAVIVFFWFGKPFFTLRKQFWNCSGVTKDVINRSSDCAFSEELAHCVGVETVLVTENPTSEEHGKVRV